MIYATPFVFLAWLLIPAQEFLEQFHRTWHALAADDLKLAEIADATVEDLAALTQGNRALQALRIACPAALATGTAAGLTTQGQGIAAMQDLREVLVLERASQATAQGFIPVDFPRFTRGLPDPCRVPGLLEWPTAPKNFLRLLGRRAGAIVTSSGSLGESAWSYRHPKVTPL